MACAQAGILAAAGLFALEHNFERLQEDHDNAQWLAEQLKNIDSINADTVRQETNMVFIGLSQSMAKAWPEYLKQHDIAILRMNPLRLVLHKDISRDDLERFLKVIKAF